MSFYQFSQEIIDLFVNAGFGHFVMDEPLDEPVNSEPEPVNQEDTNAELNPLPIDEPLDEPLDNEPVNEPVNQEDTNAELAPDPLPIDEQPNTAANLQTDDSNSTSSDRFDQEILRLVNNERANVGLDPLQIDEQLDTAANLHSSEMAQADLMSHRLPGQPLFGDRMRNIDFNKGNALAENVAAGQTTPEEVMYDEQWGWMNSTGHRNNILNPNFTHLGVGYVDAPDNDNSYNDQDTYWTQIFGSEFA